MKNLKLLLSIPVMVYAFYAAMGAFYTLFECTIDVEAAGFSPFFQYAGKAAIAFLILFFLTPDTFHETFRKKNQ